MISYTTSLTGVTAEELRGGFFVGWPNPPTPETHLRILRGSSHVVLAWDKDRVVGYINALSDGVLAAFVPGLEVLPAYQGQGIGSELVRRMLEELAPIYGVDLICDEHMVPFYERLGLIPVRGMVQRNFATQSGLPDTGAEPTS
jgi:GNAT superfamily N-acetyltransferase